MRFDRDGAASGPDKLPHAPYNFVPFPDRLKIRYETFDKLPKHDLVPTEENGLLSGRLTFDIVARTPILVAQGPRDEEDRERHFNQDVWNRFEIPGSTLRGLIRSAVGIIGHSDLTDNVDNREQTLMYRGLADSDRKGLKNRKQIYAAVINKDRVQAGYIRMIDRDHYEILPAEKINEKTFVFVREQQLYKDGVLPGPGINPMYTKEILEIEDIGRPKLPRKGFRPLPVSKQFADRRSLLEQYRDRLHNYHAKLGRTYSPADLKALENECNELYGMYYAYLRFVQSKHYAPYMVKRTVYITADGRYAFRPGQGTPHECWLMSSGFMQKKQSHYVIHPVDRHAKPLQLRPEEVHWYRYDLKVKGNRIRHRDFYSLPEKPGELKPCFYVQDGGFTYFGFTPHLRIFYRRTIGDGLPKYAENGFDYVKAMFGFADVDGQSYAGRLSFKSAVLVGEPGQIKKEEVVAGQPALSAPAMYIKQDSLDELKTMNDEYEWRGIKQYWLKRDFEKPGRNLKSATKDNDKVKTFLHLLPKGSRFAASIRFDLLHKDELGLLLAALTWPKHQLIGMGKPFGAGCVTFENIRLQLDNVSYRLDEFFADDWTEVPNERFEEYIKEFCNHMEPFCGDVRQSEPVRVYLAMREKGYDHINTAYMPLSERDGKPAYQSLLPLPTVGQLLWNEPYPKSRDSQVNLKSQEPFKPANSGKMYNGFQRKKNKPVDEHWAKLIGLFEKDND